MTIPKKGTRTVTVHEETYRYSFKDTDSEDGKLLVITVQEDRPEAGNVMQISDKMLHLDLPRDLATLQRIGPLPQGCFGVGPRDMVKIIKEAIEHGWEPGKKGPAFIMNKPVVLERKFHVNSVSDLGVVEGDAG